MKRATCTHIIKDGMVLFGRQQFKIVGLKGYGGVIEGGEDPLVAACREIYEETGGVPTLRVDPNEEGGIVVHPSDLVPMGLIDFYNGPEELVPYGDPSFRVLFLETRVFQGKAVPTKEMLDPEWYPVKARRLPIKEMVAGDEHFIPRLLTGQRIKGYIRRTPDLKEVLKYHIAPCSPEDLVI